MSRRAVPTRSAAVITLAVALSNFTVAPASAAQLFTDDFESGTLGNWTTSQAFTVQNVIKLGNFAGRGTSTGAASFASKTLGSNQANVYMAAQVHAVSNAALTTILRFKTSTGAKLLSLNINATEKLQIKNHVSGVTTTSSTVLPLASFHEMQLHGLINGPSGQAEVWLDGIPVAALSGTQNLGTAPIRQVEIGTNGTATGGFDVVFDDVVVDTSFIGGGPPTEPPPTPTGLTVTDTTSTTVSLQWVASAGATTYNLFRDSVDVGDATGTTFQDSGLTPSTTYDYTINACNSAGCSAVSSPAVPATTDPPPPTGETVVMAAGDIACDPADANFNGGNGTATRCRQKFTAQVVVAEDPDAVLAIGDTQYECGGTAAYAASYNPSWGQFKAKTYPIVADQEYATSGTDCGTPGADGYFNYFANAPQGAPGAPNGYYSFDLGGWHFIGLNSECGDIPGGCGEGGAQNNFLEADLTATTETCTLAMLHKPLFASKKSGSQVNSSMGPFWDDLYAFGADIILAGNSHFYERFEKQDPGGAAAADGIVEFIVGTGGKSHGGLADPGLRLPTSENGSNKVFGLLMLTLHPTSYDWEFVVEGSSTFSDSGTGSCVS